MRKTLTLLALLSLTIAATAQTLNITVGSVTYQFPASLAGDMTFTDGTTLTILNKSFTLSEVSSMSIDNSTPTDNTVTVNYGSSPTVTIVGSAAQYVTVNINGTQVAINQTNSDTDNAGEITYSLTGSASGSYPAGLFYLIGSYKSSVDFNGVTLTNTAGPAVCINNGKRIEISSKSGTTNTLTGLGTSSYKGCLYIKGHSEFKGTGTLNINCSDYHGIKSNEYMTLKNCTLTVNMTGSSSNLKDAIHVSEFFQQTSGVITATGTAYSDDAIQVELDGTTSTGELTDHDGEDSGNIYIEGGSLTATAANTGTKALKGDGDIKISGGSLTLYANGAIDTSVTTDISYTSGLKAGGDITISGGSVNVTVNGAAGRGIACDGTFTATDGSITVVNKGALTSSGSTYYCTAKGIKAAVVNISGGTFDITMSGAASKGIKADSDDGDGNMTISGGTFTITTSGAGAYDGVEKDAKGSGCLKADNNMTISGGELTLKATGTGGKCIKADNYLYIQDNANISATTTGSKYTYSSSVTASPKAIKAGTATAVSSAPALAPGGWPGGGGPGGGGNTTQYTYTGGMVISGGTVFASSTNHEAIESKSTLDITGGTVYAYSYSEDAINAASHFTISGGNVMGYSMGNDGLDANGNFYIKGGNVVAISARSPEVALDANTEGGYKLYLQGGNVVAVGGLESGYSASGVTVKTSSFSTNTWYKFTSGGTTKFSFKVPTNSSGTSTLYLVSASTPAISSGSSGSTTIWNGYGMY